MATKLYNSHLSKIIFECNEYYILDTYISLVAISSEVDSKYIIQTSTSSKADLIALVRRNLNASYKTVFNCITKLIEKSILAFDDVLDDGFSINLLKYNSGWMKVLKTKCKYYAKYTIDKMLNKYSEGFNWEMISIVNRGFLNYYKYGTYFMVDYLDWLKRGVCWAYIINLDENTFEVYERNWNHKDDDTHCNMKKLCDDKYILQGTFDLKQIPKTWNNDVD